MPPTSPFRAAPDLPTAGSWAGVGVTRRPCRRYGRRIGVAALTALLTVGCGAPPEVRDSGGGLPTRAATTTPSSPTSPTTPSFDAFPGTGPTLPSADPGLVAVACTGEPSVQRITELIRGRRGLLPGNARVSVRNGPMCAADWQLTVFDVAGYEPLQVVTRDRAGTLRLVTAGTDVCTAEVRVASPAGIQTLACGSDGGGLPVPVTPPTSLTPLTPLPSLSPSPSGSSPTRGA
ncbi:hypothetical protein Vlu01_26860 [Micromonospora lutea]|uniref:Lipoprotein n=1 Tax=Micromonospora lutea TaxID=419825 RepID=A0ABQ4IVV4_9ACTN|nr:hypothetical protein Vlu01_26860 [Micromonospora lutea]